MGGRPALLSHRPRWFQDTGRPATVIQFDMDTSITLVNVDTSTLLVQSDVFILV